MRDFSNPLVRFRFRRDSPVETRRFRLELSPVGVDDGDPAFAGASASLAPVIFKKSLFFKCLKATDDDRGTNQLTPCSNSTPSVSSRVQAWMPEAKVGLHFGKLNSMGKKSDQWLFSVVMLLKLKLEFIFTLRRMAPFMGLASLY